MARIITFEGVQHSFPDDVTDEEIATALDGSDIGSTVGDKRRLTNPQILNLLKAQLADPARDPSSTAELEREIQRYEKRIGDAPVVHTTPAPIVQQGDVRKSEPTPGALATQQEREANFERATKEFLSTTGGRLKPNQNIRQAVEEWSGFQDPMKTRGQAEMAHVAGGGDVADITGDSVAYNIIKPAAALAGFAKGGPAGATASEGIVRATALAYNLNRAVESGALSKEEAYDIALKEIPKGMGEDALFNFGVPFASNYLRDSALLRAVADKTGLTWLKDRAAAGIAAGAKKLGLPSGTPAAPAPSERDVKLAERAKLTEDPARKQAVAELGARLPADKVMTPGQVTEYPSWWESGARKGQPRQFDVLDKEMETAADKLLRETTTPVTGQPSRQGLGQQIQDLADTTQAAVKKRLRPAFEAADQLGVKVDLTEVRQAASKALLADSKVPGGKLAPAEREQLQSIFEFLRTNPKIGAEEALDFVSRRKEQLRATTADWKPSAAYDKTIGDFTKLAETAYARAAGSAGKGDVVKGLLDAQRDYKEVMGTVYDDAIKAALKKNPEDVGRFLWTGGNVSEPQQLQKMMGIANREGKLSTAQAIDLSRAVTRGFMQEAVPNIEAAAKWSQTLKESPGKRDTWMELTKGPGGQQLRNTMEVIEQAAQMALNKNIVMAGGTGLAQRAGSGAGGITASKVHPGMLAGMISYAAGMKMAATAYTHGDYGHLNLLARALRTQGAGTALSSKAAQEANAQVQAYLQAHNIPNDEQAE